MFSRISRSDCATVSFDFSWRISGCEYLSIMQLLIVYLKHDEMNPHQNWKTRDTVFKRYTYFHCFTLWGNITVVSLSWCAVEINKEWMRYLEKNNFPWSSTKFLQFLSITAVVCVTVKRRGSIQECIFFSTVPRMYYDFSASYTTGRFKPKLSDGEK